MGGAIGPGPPVSWGFPFGAWAMWTEDMRPTGRPRTTVLLFLHGTHNSSPGEPVSDSSECARFRPYTFHRRLKRGLSTRTRSYDVRQVEAV